MTDPDPEEIIAFMVEQYSVKEIASLGRQALYYFLPPLAGKIKVAPGPPPPRSDPAEGGVDHPATAICSRLLLEKNVPCSHLPDLNDSELRREVTARLRSLNLVLIRARGRWRLYWMEEPPT